MFPQADLFDTFMIFLQLWPKVVYEASHALSTSSEAESTLKIFCGLPFVL